jgi:isoleucyl-tRNA synthetase
MKYQSGTRKKAVEYEKALVKYWKENKIFEESVSQRSEANAYVFYDGPPFITGTPHHGTLLSSVVKDAVPRFWAMQGKRVERTWGWDCHGLPAEVFTEKKLGIEDKRDIGTKISLEDYITTCRDNMVTTGDLWEDTIDRIGRWVDFKGAYKTMDKEYMESVWWAFKTLYDKGKIYEGEKVLLYCTRDATPISKAEVAMDNSYQEVTDPSVYVKFELKGYSSQSDTSPSSLLPQPSVYLLAWTTTPWTLNANTAIVINKDIKYTEIELLTPVNQSLQGLTLQESKTPTDTTDTTLLQGQTLQEANNGGEGQEKHTKTRLIIADNLLDKVLTNEKHQILDYRVVRTFKGQELVGLSYEPLFADRGENAHKVWHADFVTDEDGTGIAHQAPGYGEDDYTFAKANDIPFILDTDEEGYYTEGPWKGEQIWQHNKQIAKDLKEQGVVWKIDYIKHEYPHCHRCGTKLQYRAHPSWFMDVDNQKTEMLEQNSSINWFPEHVKNGRFEKTVQSAPDWNISRDRFWATAMPVWKGTDTDGNNYIKVVGNYAELKELSGVELEDYHRPWIDDVTFTINGVLYTRIDKVLDCWFESGSMPFAQFHYPFENVQKFEDNFPGDFISEYVGQVRAWFYYLHAVNVGLFGKSAFKNVIVTGTVAGNDGRKMSKSFGNFTDPNLLMDTYSADALRFLFLSSSLMNGEDFALNDRDVSDISRKLSMIWNVYDFFTMYAEVDGWEWNGELQDHTESCENVLDTWILSKIHTLINDVEKATKEYDLQRATRSILPFIDDLSNWYVRRSRKRFWKSDDDRDKQFAYKTLHYVLVQFAHVVAPFAPFIADELYINLTGNKSVHLNDWPKVGHINELVVGEMDSLRSAVNDGLSLRAKSQIKTRQPLASITVSGARDLGPQKDNYLKVLEEELNVKAVSWISDGEYSVELDFNLTPELISEGLSRELVRLVQSARKDADLQVDDRINLILHTESPDLMQAISAHADYISSETLAVSVNTIENDLDYSTDKTINGETVKIRLSKV